jgi:tRNA threonylcarbamoyl adenosine modification protein YeaZ
MELIIDGSSQTLVGAIKSNQTYSHFTINNKIKHSQKLMSCVQKFIKETGENVENIERIGIGVGPGSFTGLRISVAFIKGLSSALRVDLVPIPSMKIYSYLSEEKTVTVVIPAREGYVYVAKYNDRNLIGNYEILEYSKAISELGDNEVVGYGCTKLGIELPWYKKYPNGMALIRAYESIDKIVKTNELELIYVQEPLAVKELRKRNDRKIK